jgi:methylisocitrate lyase
MRSNDLWFGFCNDQYQFSKLQEMVSKRTGYNVGTYYHFAHNLHLYEDQIPEKRCGHLDNKELISKEDMVKKIKTSVQARKDKNFLIIVRTDANTVEGLEKTLDRIKAYEDAGADMIFPEAMKDENEFESVRKISKVSPSHIRIRACIR